MPLDPTPPPAAPAAAQVGSAAAPAGGTAAPEKPAEPQTVTIPADAFQSLTAAQTRLAKMEEETRQREQDQQREQAAILAKKGEIENALNLLRTESDKQLAAERASRTMTEDRAKRYALDAEVSRVLAGLPLVPGAPEQLTRLFRSEFQVDPQGDSFAVRTPQFQSVGDFVAATLAKPEYAHFVRAQNPGGGTGGVSPASQASPTPAAQTAALEQPKTLSDAIILTMKEMAKAGGSGADPTLDMRAGMGLRASHRKQA